MPEDVRQNSIITPNLTTTTFRITTRGYCAAIIVRQGDGLVMQSAPILQRHVGKYWAVVRRELLGQGADIVNLSEGFDTDDCLGEGGG